MASIDEIVDKLQSAIDKVNEAVQSVNAAESDAGDMQSQMAAMGIQDKVEVLGSVKDAIERARNHLSGGTDLTEEAMSQAKSVSG
jgi:2-methylisocitrate lyase-like PEP mutase family enzyme